MELYQKARMARDSRYDGKFFVAVKTTKIYCRPICPAPSPQEKNVYYFDSAIQAEQAGYRPCLRCRPESAPYSAAWMGNQAILTKAINKIDAGELNHQSLPQLCAQMGIGDRYLRKLFNQHLGVTPTAYANHVRLMFAKKLLHETSLPITEIAFSSGFGSLRRFNDAFQQTMRMSPTELRKMEQHKKNEQAETLQLTLPYRPPYNWQLMYEFLKARELTAMESVETNGYQRSFQFKSCIGYFKAIHQDKKHHFNVSLQISDLRYLMPVIEQIKKVLDLNTDLNVVEKHLQQNTKLKPIIQSGMRLPACWDSFEAGVKAILGQQVSVKAAYGHTALLIEQLGNTYNSQFKIFPTAEQVASADLSFLKMPQSRKDTLKTFAKWFAEHRQHDLSEILSLKGIGQWTYQYVKLRSGDDSDAFPEKDLGVIKAMKNLDIDYSQTSQWQPWRSYATLQLWNSL